MYNSEGEIIAIGQPLQQHKIRCVSLRITKTVSAGPQQLQAYVNPKLSHNWAPGAATLTLTSVEPCPVLALQPTRSLPACRSLLPAPRIGPLPKGMGRAYARVQNTSGDSSLRRRRPSLNGVPDIDIKLQSSWMSATLSGVRPMWHTVTQWHYAYGY